MLSIDPHILFEIPNVVRNTWPKPQNILIHGKKIVQVTQISIRKIKGQKSIFPEFYNYFRFTICIINMNQNKYIDMNCSKRPSCEVLANWIGFD